MSDAPIRLPVSRFRTSPPAITKIRRGGTGKIGNSGTAAGRFHTPTRQLRSPKDGKQIPWRLRGKVIWDPTDPFIIAYQQAHPHTEARWRSNPAPNMVAFDIETRDAGAGFI